MNGYHIEKNYRKVTVWCFNAKTHEREATITRTPDRKQTRAEKAACIFDMLASFNIPSPPFKP